MDFLDESGLTRLWQHFTSKLATKVTKVNGMGLSSNDYTTAEKNKLSDIESGAQVNTVTSVNGQTGNVIIDVSSVDANHIHEISDIDNLQTVLNSKASTSIATQSSNGLMSADDKIKLDGLSNSSGSGSGSTTLADLGITATAAELNCVDGVTSNIQTQINSINDDINYLYENVGSSGSGSGSGSYDPNHTHNYAGSSSAGGPAISANMLNTDAGSSTQPVFFKDGVPVATDYSLDASVPFDAQFTDTTYDLATIFQDGLMSASDKMKLNNISGFEKTLEQHLASEPMILSSLQFGNSLPASGEIGQIFFLRVGS